MTGKELAIFDENSPFLIKYDEVARDIGLCFYGRRCAYPKGQAVPVEAHHYLFLDESGCEKPKGETPLAQRLATWFSCELARCELSGSHLLFSPSRFLRATWDPERKAAGR